MLKIFIRLLCLWGNFFITFFKLSISDSKKISYIIRCLLLKTNDPEKWKGIHEMVAHNDIRKKKPELWKNNQLMVVDKIRKVWGMTQYNEEEIHTICGILEVKILIFTSLIRIWSKYQNYYFFFPGECIRSGSNGCKHSSLISKSLFISTRLHTKHNPHRWCKKAHNNKSSNKNKKRRSYHFELRLHVTSKWKQLYKHSKKSIFNSIFSIAEYTQT